MIVHDYVCIDIGYEAVHAMAVALGGGGVGARPITMKSRHLKIVPSHDTPTKGEMLLETAQFQFTIPTYVY